MSPEQMTEALHSKAEATRVGPAPVDRMRHNVARQKRGRAIALAAASVALVLGGGAVVQEVVTSDGGPDRNNTTIPQAPVPPDGMKLVGMGKVVIAVPEAWRTYNTLCSSPRSDGVFFGIGQVDCLYGEPAAGTPVLMLDLNSTEGDQLAQLATAESVINGVEVLRELVECPDTASCLHHSQEVVVVPSEEVVVAVRKGRSGSDVLDTLQLLPQGFTTVPSFDPRAVRSAVETGLVDVGLNPSSAASDVDGLVLATDPPAGSVVHLGDTVTLALVADQQAPTGQNDPNLRELVGGTQEKWDPRQVDDLPTSDTGEPLPQEVEPPAVSPWVRDAPIEAAVLAVQTGDTAQLLSTDGEWRQVPLTGPYPRVALSPQGTQLLVWKYGNYDEIVVYDLDSTETRTVEYPDGFEPWDFTRWEWLDEEVVMLDDLRGGWLIDTVSGSGSRLPFPKEFAWVPDPNGGIVEVSDYDSSAVLTDWAAWADWSEDGGRTVSEAATGRLMSLQADGETVAGTSYDDRPFSVVMADRASLRPQAVLPLVDHEGNYSGGGLGVLALPEDGTVLLRVVVFGGSEGFRIVRWDPASGDLTVASSVETRVENDVVFASGLLSEAS